MIPRTVPKMLARTAGAVRASRNAHSTANPKQIQVLRRTAILLFSLNKPTRGRSRRRGRKRWSETWDLRDQAGGNAGRGIRRIEEKRESGRRRARGQGSRGNCTALGKSRRREKVMTANEERCGSLAARDRARTHPRHVVAAVHGHTGVVCGRFVQMPVDGANPGGAALG